MISGRSGSTSPTRAVATTRRSTTASAARSPTATRCSTSCGRRPRRGTSQCAARRGPLPAARWARPSARGGLRGESDADPGPLFVDVCLDAPRRDRRAARDPHANTNEVGRVGGDRPRTHRVAARLGAPLGLVDVGCRRGSTCSATATASTTDRRARPVLLMCRCRSVARSSVGRRRSPPDASFDRCTRGPRPRAAG